MGGRSSRFSWSWSRYPDRTGTINSETQNLNTQSGILNSKKREARGIQSNVNNVVADKNRYNYLKNKYETEHAKQDKILHGCVDCIEEGKRPKRQRLEREIKDKNTDIDNTYSSADGTKSLIAAAVVTKRGTNKRIDSIYDNTEQRNKDIYYGMNRTNNSLLNTITTTNNNHTADISKVTYQNEQSSYFSWLNNVLFIVYFILWIIFAFILYRIKGNISTFIKVISIIALLLFPFLSIIYYKIYI